MSVLFWTNPIWWWGFSPGFLGMWRTLPLLLDQSPRWPEGVVSIVVYNRWVLTNKWVHVYLKILSIFIRRRRRLCGEGEKSERKRKRARVPPNVAAIECRKFYTLYSLKSPKRPTRNAYSPLVTSYIHPMLIFQLLWFTHTQCLFLTINWWICLKLDLSIHNIHFVRLFYSISTFSVI